MDGWVGLAYILIQELIDCDIIKKKRYFMSRGKTFLIRRSALHCRLDTSFSGAFICSFYCSSIEIIFIKKINRCAIIFPIAKNKQKTPKNKKTKQRQNIRVSLLISAGT